MKIGGRLRQGRVARRIGAWVLVSFSLGLAGCARIRDWQENRRQETARRELAALAPIDAHTHISRTGPAFVAMLEHLNMHVMDILYVDDTTASRSSLERQRQEALNFIASSHGYATLCTTFDPFGMNEADFAQQAIASLNQDFANGAVAAKVWKNVGMEIKNGAGHYVMPDDAAFAPIYRDIAQEGKTLVIHAAAVDAAWKPESGTADGRYFEANPQWDMSRKPGAPSKAEILAARDRLLKMNPGLRVIGAHLGSMEAQLTELGERLDRYPNFAIDISARVRNLTVLPHDEVRAFFLKYQDRILYGTDLSFSAGDEDAATAQVWEQQYLRDWEYFSSGGSILHAGRTVQGLGLPPEVLRKLYHDNAVRWLPGIAGDRR